MLLFYLSTTVFVHLEPSLTLNHPQLRDGCTLQTQVGRTLHAGLHSLTAYIWTTDPNPVYLCKTVLRLHIGLCVCVCVCVFGFLFSTYEKNSQGKDNAPTAGKDEIICKWLVKSHIIFLISSSKPAFSGADTIYHVIIYLGAF